MRLPVFFQLRKAFHDARIGRAAIVQHTPDIEDVAVIVGGDIGDAGKKRRLPVTRLPVTRLRGGRLREGGGHDPPVSLFPV